MSNPRRHPRRYLSLAALAIAVIAAGAFLLRERGAPAATAACRVDDDCSRSGMPGATCGEDGRCAYTGIASGQVRFDQRVPGTVRVVAYPTAAFDVGGPHPAYTAVGHTASLVDNGDVVDYELAGLPAGEVMVLAYIDINDDDPSPRRPCYGDVAGLAKVDVSGSRRAADVDIQVGATVIDRAVCKGL